MIAVNPNIDLYKSMSIEDLEKEYRKGDLTAEDRTAILHAIARKRSSNITSMPVDAKPIPVQQKK